ncbi:helicase-associated domain-containing protein [Ornithinimicrobium sp. W1679]|uniref:helicase-associated domain-containing protein n=1 Tax=Ornithinimicrobium sp. W1679 TaxID=3418770 RepID=UPI003CE6879B
MSVRSLADDLRGRSDEELAALLRARPDLARPTPADVTTLAARATTLASVRRALDHLDLAHLQALEAVVVAAPAGPAEVAALLGTSAERAEALTGRLRTLALCWSSADGLLPARPVLEVVGDPAGLAAADVRPSPGVSADPDGALADLDPPGRQLLDALTWGPAVGTLPQDPDAPMATAARSLVEAGLLVRQDEAHVVLPRVLALRLREGRLHRHPAPEPPAVETTGLDQEVVDAAAGGRAGDLLVLVTEVLDRWGARPPRVLRSGGLAVRDLTRLAAHLEVGQDETAWLLETALAAGLVAADDGGPRGTGEPAWVPTTAADDWLEAGAGARWAALAAAWWSMPAAPSLVTSGDAGRVNALSVHTSYPLGRVRRHDALAALATLPAGSAPTLDGLTELLRWRHPLRTARAADLGPGLEVVAREAEWAAVTGRGALGGPGRAVVTGDDPARVAALMEPLVPPAVDHVLLQADLTAVAPGRLDGPVRSLLQVVSDVESRGGASVHRFSETSVRRALDLGWSADRVLAELADASRTGVPQPLDYLVRDVARRHGQARVGACAAYLRSDDPALLDRIERDRALGMLQWRRIAPSVLVSPVPAPTVVDLLREQQYGPLVEGGDGGLEVSTTTARRTSPRTSSPVRVSSVDDQVARQVVAQLRRGEVLRPRRVGGEGEGLDADGTEGLAGSAGLGGPGGAEGTGAGAFGRTADPVVVAAVLREAVADGVAVRIGYADDAGGVGTHLVRPLAVEAGRLRAGVGDGDARRTFLLHRITGVAPVD